MQTKRASVQFFERDDGKRWRSVGSSKDAVLGKNGLAWSWAHSRFAAKGEPTKKEGDGRTPVGFFTVGQAFGFASEKRRDYVTLKKGAHFCVDDPRSPLYNAVVPRADAGDAVSGEDMAKVPHYEQGLFLDYPTNRALQGGSCIFVHIWRAKESATVGCVALARHDVEEMQRWSAGKTTVMGILPEPAWRRLRPCLEGV